MLDCWTLVQCNTEAVGTGRSLSGMPWPVQCMGLLLAQLCWDDDGSCYVIGGILDG